MRSLLGEVEHLPTLQVFASLTSRRYGFNSGGHQVVKENLEKQLLAGQKATVIGINLGKNKSSEDAASDYSSGLVAFSKCQSVDYFVVFVFIVYLPSSYLIPGYLLPNLSTAHVC